MLYLISFGLLAYGIYLIISHTIDAMAVYVNLQPDLDDEFKRASRPYILKMLLGIGFVLIAWIMRP